MIARIWRGVVRTEDAAEYVEYVQKTGIEGYRSIPGNLGAWILQRQIDETTEIVTLSFWESIDAVRGFAGEDVSRAVYYPEDDRFLIERNPRVEHYDIA